MTTFPCCNPGCVSTAPGGRQPWCSPTCRRRVAELTVQEDLAWKISMDLAAKGGFVLTDEQRQMILDHYTLPPQLTGVTIPAHIKEILDKQTRQFALSEQEMGPPPAVTYDDIISFYQRVSDAPGVTSPVELTSEQAARLPRVTGTPPIWGVPVKIVDPEPDHAPQPSTRRRWWHRFTRRPQ